MNNQDILPPLFNEVTEMKNPKIHCTCKTIWRLGKSCWFWQPSEASVIKKIPKQEEISIWHNYLLRWVFPLFPNQKKKGLENCKFNRSILDYEEGWQNIHISYMIQWYNLEEKSKKKKIHLSFPILFLTKSILTKLKKKIIISGPIWEWSLMHRAGNVFFCTVNRSAENDHMTSFPKLEWN